MNYLAHLFLGPKDPEQALGSLLGDFVRGPVHSLDLPQGVREGIWLHPADRQLYRCPSSGAQEP